MIVLAATGGCLYNISNRIIYLGGNPKSTTISSAYMSSITFPAVTICNLNTLTRSYAVQQNLSSLLKSVIFFTDPFSPNDTVCEDVLADSNIDPALSFGKALFYGRNNFNSFVTECAFLGRECTEDDFMPSFTQLGYCYTFNSGHNSKFEEIEPKTTIGTGTRHGLRLLLNISQDDYAFPTNFDAGVKIAVHPQGEPADPDDIGIAVSPGMNAFIAVRAATFSDTSSTRTCQETDQVNDLNFLEQFYNYSVQACNIDCLYTSIADTCNCTDTEGLSPSREPYRSLPECQATDFCCELSPYAAPPVCSCPLACEYTAYSLSSSYSAFPANFLIDPTLELLEFPVENLTAQERRQIIRDNIIAVNVYFETLNVQVLMTSDLYDIVALLSDIGGQLGLFIGASVISVVEFVVWCFDEAKDRTCRLSDRKTQSAFQMRKKMGEIDTGDLERKDDAIKIGNLVKADQSDTGYQDS